MFCTTDNSKPGGCKLSTDTTRISFGNDLNGDRNVANCSDSACASVTDYDRNEEITYNFDASNRTLYRASNLDTALTFPSPAPKVAQLGSGCMSFTYFGDDTTADADRDPDVLAGGPPPSNCVFSSLNPLTTSNESKVKIVRLTIIVQVKRGASTGATQMLTTDVALRNRAR
jgi:hypothetical protein